MVHNLSNPPDARDSSNGAKSPECGLPILFRFPFKHNGWWDQCEGAMRVERQQDQQGMMKYRMNMEIEFEPEIIGLIIASIGNSPGKQ